MSVALIASAGSACAGGDDTGTTSATGITAPKKKGTASQRAIDPAAQAHAESLLLTLSDFPDGWRGSPSEDDDEDDDKHRRCIGTDYSAFTITGEADSDQFSMGESTTAESEATVFKSESDAQGSLQEFADGMRGPTAEDCFGRIIKKALRGEDYKLGEVDIGELSFSAPEGVDEARAWQLVIPLEPTSDQGINVTVYIDVLHVREGDVLASVTTQDVLSPFDADLRRKLVEVVAGRMQTIPS